MTLTVDGFASSRGALQDPHQEGARNMKNPADWEKHKARLGATTAAQNNHRTTARPSHSVHANALSLGFLPFGSAHLSAAAILCGQFYLAPQFLRKRTFKSKTGVFRENPATRSRRRRPEQARARWGSPARVALSSKRERKKNATQHATPERGNSPELQKRRRLRPLARCAGLPYLHLKPPVLLLKVRVLKN